MLRDVVVIDEDKCDGCELCITSCAEGALQMVDGKAKLVSDVYCDGLGVCIGECPQDAITVEKREAEVFDETAVEEHLTKLEKQKPPVIPVPVPHHAEAHSCPGSMMRTMDRPVSAATTGSKHQPMQSELKSWPIQLHLLNSNAPFLQNADILLAADCVPFAYPDFHNRFMQGRVLAIGCPKLDDVNPYIDKLAHIFAHSNIKSLTVVHMEVPCCNGIVQIAQQAMGMVGAQFPVTDVMIGIQGGIVYEQEIPAAAVMAKGA
ncbi:MAG: 4Fe-4S binding protein [Candidatus Electryonea clarkiae]|nr:4Fe-4S binding protein [Candidatus Electryonea clarkiae]MDP8287081.1 4Fe-4S binding protein [Candidatus Electryonea clarkiae]